MSNPKRMWVIQISEGVFWAGFDGEGDPLGAPLKDAKLFTEMEVREQLRHIPIMVGVQFLLIKKLSRLKPERVLSEEILEPEPDVVDTDSDLTPEPTKAEEDKVEADFISEYYRHPRESRRRGDTGAFLRWLITQLILTRRALKGACRNQLIVEALSVPEADEMIAGYTDADDDELIQRYMRQARGEKP